MLNINYILLLVSLAQFDICAYKLVYTHYHHG